MGLDKNDPRPSVDLQKRSTKVNISIVAAVIVFLLLASIVVFALHREPAKSTTEAIPLPAK